MLLYATAHKTQQAFPAPVQEFLHEQLRYFRDAAQLYRRKFNFALLAEEARKPFGYPFQSNSIRRFALRHGYYFQRPVVRQTVESYGRPLTYDVNNHRVRRWVIHQSYRDTMTTAEAEARVQFRRVLRSLDIGIIHSTKGEPAARGKIEKRFDYFQRRLPFLCEK